MDREDAQEESEDAERTRRRPWRSRSPKREVIIAAGTLLTSEPTPVRATTRLESATEAPRSRALNAMTGRIAPFAIP